MANSLNEEHCLRIDGCSMGLSEAKNDMKDTGKIKEASIDFISKTDKIPSSLIVDGMLYSKRGDRELDTLNLGPDGSRSVQYRSDEKNHIIALMFKRVGIKAPSLVSVESRYDSPATQSHAA